MEDIFELLNWVFEQLEKLIKFCIALIISMILRIIKVYKFIIE